MPDDVIYSLFIQVKNNVLFAFLGMHSCLLLIYDFICFTIQNELSGNWVRGCHRLSVSGVR